MRTDKTMRYNRKVKKIVGNYETTGEYRAPRKGEFYLLKRIDYVIEATQHGYLFEREIMRKRRGIPF